MRILVLVITCIVFLLHGCALQPGYNRPTPDERVPPKVKPAPVQPTPVQPPEANAADYLCLLT